MATIRQIAQLGHEVLRRNAEKISLPVSADISTLIEDMLVTLQDANGVGLAAPQVYESKRIFIVASRPNPRYPNAPMMQPTAMINPEILSSSPEIERAWEGCLSIPGIRGMVPRPKQILVRYQTQDGQSEEQDLSDFIARVFLHEYDHLEGIVYLDRLESPKDIITEKEYMKLVRP